VGDERVQWFRDFLADWNSGDTGEREGRWDRLHPEFELDSQIVGHVVRGEEGVRRWWAEIDEQFDAFELKAVEEREFGEGLFLVFGTLRLRGKESGLEMDQEIAWRLEFDGDKLRLLKPYTNPDLALKEAGLD
jgi:hypothetical protein